MNHLKKQISEILAGRSAERQELIDKGRLYVRDLKTRVNVVAAAVTGSVARGDFNVWSDIDVVVVAEGLPARIPDRLEFISSKAPPRLQAIALTPQEFRQGFERGNPLVREAVSAGVVLDNDAFFRTYLEAKKINPPGGTRASEDSPT